jgi:4-amino-4-deoxy-L-arabinose transferase-like glycosyltransferase
MRRGPTLRHLLILSALCAAAYLPGLTSHGLTNWQESIRLVVAQEMHRTANWVTPTVHAEPYLAKPPMLYWAQMALASLRGAAVSLFDLRLAVALAGWLGVLATYLAARVLLAPSPDDETPDATDRWARAASFWGAAFTATGILTARASRIGELDILLLPCTGVGIAAFSAAWRTHLAQRRTNLPAIALGALAAAAAGLVKGPPGFATMLVATLGGVLLHGAFAGRPRPRAPLLIASAVASAAFATWLFTAREIRDYRDILGILIHALTAGAALLLLARLSTRPAWLAGLLRSGVLLGPLAGMAALWLWGLALERDVGREVVEMYAARESAANLQPFVPASPVRNLEAFAYGAGLGSIAAIVAAVWLVRDRPRFASGWWVVLGWIALGFVLYSVAGTGTQRYVLPVLPGVALLGGMWFAAALRDLPARLTLARAAWTALIALAVGQGVWYGFARDRAGYDWRSPDAFMDELLAAPGVDPARLATLDFWTGAIDAAAGQPVRVYRGPGMPLVDGYPHIAPKLPELTAELAAEGSAWTILVVEPPMPGQPLPAQRFADAGLAATPIETTAEFRLDKGQDTVRAYRVTPAPDTGP